MFSPLRLALVTAAACSLASAAVAQSQDDVRPPRTDSATAAADRPAPSQGAVAPRDSATGRAPSGAPATPAPVAAPSILPGAGTIRMNGLLQAWYLTGTATARSTFRLRRAELRLSGDFGRQLGWALGIDAAKALAMSPTYVTVNGQRVVAEESVNLASQILQDAMVSVRAPGGIAIDVGQTRVPLGFAGTQGNARLETVERPMFASDRARGGALADVRDVGVLVRGSALRRVDVAVGAFNGSGESQNGVDRNAQKSVAGRVLVHGLVTGLQVGASGVYGGHPGADYTRRDRLGAEAQYAAGPLVARAEYMAGADGATHRAGWYGHAGVRARRGLELVARYDVFDPDTHHEGSVATARAHEVLGGANLALGGTNATLQLDYAVRSFRDHAAPTRGQLLLNLQTSW